MTDLSALQLLDAGVFATAATVWAGIAVKSWRFKSATSIPFFKLMRNLATVAALLFGFQAALRLVPAELAAAPPLWLVALWLTGEWLFLAAGSLARHTTRYWGFRLLEPLSRSWLVVNYGAAVVLMAVALAVPIVGRSLMAPYLVARSLFMAVMFGLAVLDMARVTRRGPLRPGAGALFVRPADVIVFVGGIAVMLVGIGLLVSRAGPALPSWTGVAIDAAIATLVTLPVAVRELQGAIKSLVVAVAIAASAALTLLCVGPLIAPLAEAGAPRLALVLLVAATAAVVAPTARGAGPLVDRLLFGRRRRLWEELQQFLGSLAPQDGATECCRRAIAELVRALGLRGAAIVLRDGEVVVHGNMPGAEELARAWPRGEALDALPGSSFDPSLLNRLPTATVEALIGAGIIGYLMITSPRRRWGTIFGTSGLIEPSPADEPALEAFAAQLALVLDTTALLEHTVAVERSLAHAEKLAAIGEVAARIAHEIRNPVTAARSLAQLMERDPTAPENVESASLILSELERVERHVRDLLRFARREEYASDPVDLGDLARDALGPFVGRLAAAEVAVAVAATPGIVVRGDREKLRQVLVNLVENALDALGDVPERRLDLAVERNGDRATLRVTDSGRGIPSDALPRVFEPFFSTKETGTGLGLAIVRRIIDAHGGRITAEPGSPRGTTFRVDLPA